jgi:hypothetical protein
MPGGASSATKLAGLPDSGLLLLALPLDAADRVNQRSRRRLVLLLQRRCALAGELEDTVIGHRLDQELSQRPYQRIHTGWRVACPSPVKLRREGAHLVFQLGERADVVDPALLIERRDRFGARCFPATGPNGRDRDIGVDHSDRRLDHCATVIALRDNAVGMVLPVCSDGDPRPFDRLIFSRGVGKHIAVTLVILSDDDDARGLVDRFGLAVVQAYMRHVIDNAEESVRQVIDRIGGGSFAYRMDDGLPLRVAITIDHQARDFTGTGRQRDDNFNAPPAVIRSAVLYALRCLVSSDIPS